MKNVVAMGLVALALAGCANLNSINHKFKPDEGDSLSIDAKQRTVYTVTKNYGDATWKAFCAEPSPDALSALSASLGLDAAGATKALGVALASQEGAASIGLRTQTITVLRDAMYRLCEGYASGALDDVGFSRLQRRYQGIMLGLLAIEQLTGAVVANQAVLGGSAEARLGQSLGHVTGLVQEARAKSVAAKADLSAKTAAQVSAQQELDAADAALKKAIEDAKGQETDAVKTATKLQKEKSDALGKALQATKAAVAEEAVQSRELASLEALRKDLDRATAIAAVSGSFSRPGTGASGTADAAALKEIASTIHAIVLTIVDHDYSKETCMDTITSRSTRSATNLDLLELQLYFCAFAIQEKAVYAAYRNDASKTRPLQSDGVAEVNRLSKEFTNNVAGWLAARREQLKAAGAAKEAGQPPADRK